MLLSRSWFSVTRVLPTVIQWLRALSLDQCRKYFGTREWPSNLHRHAIEGQPRDLDYTGFEVESLRLTDPCLHICQVTYRSYDDSDSSGSGGLWWSTILYKPPFSFISTCPHRQHFAISHHHHHYEVHDDHDLGLSFPYYSVPRRLCCPSGIKRCFCAANNISYRWRHMVCRRMLYCHLVIQSYIYD